MAWIDPENIQLAEGPERDDSLLDRSPREIRPAVAVEKHCVPREEGLGDVIVKAYAAFGMPWSMDDLEPVGADIDDAATFEIGDVQMS